MAVAGPLLLLPSVEAVRRDVAEMSRGLEMVARCLVAAAEHCATMEARLEERQRCLDERWRRMEQQAQDIEENLVERWCGRRSLEIRLTTLESSIAQALDVVFPRVEELLSHVKKTPVNHPAPFPRSSTSNPSTSLKKNTSASHSPVLPATSNPSTSLKKNTSASHSPVLPATSNPSTSLKKNTSASHSPVLPATSSPCASTSSSSSSQVRSCAPHSPDLGSKLRSAANIGKCELLKMLIQQGANVNSTSRSGRTALHCAAFRGSTQCISELLQHGACVNAADKTKVTPLHCAVLNGHKNATRALLEAGASLSAKDSSGQTVFDIESTEQIHQILRGVSSGTLRSAVSTSQNTTRAVPSESVIFTSRHSVEESLLRNAANSGDYSKVGDLLRQRVNPNSQNDNGRTALHLAALNGHLDCVRLLLDYSGDPNIEDVNNKTPQDYARQGNHILVVHALIASESISDSDYE